MDADIPHQLQTLLQFLVTDASCIAHLADILNQLSSSSLGPSPHLQKWVTRVTSLMHSKDPAARWAAICIAYRMSFLSESLLVENAQSWVGITFPSLLKSEPVPILRASIRYLTLVLCAAGRNPEFQRQVAIPMVLKVSSALLGLVDKHNDRDIKTSSIQTLACLVSIYPSLHKALNQRLFALCHQIFSGSVPHVTDGLLDATVNLYAVLHLLGGKVGSTNVWQGCLHEVLQLSWSAWLALRTTYPTSAQLSCNAIAYLRLPEEKLPDPLSLAKPMTDHPSTTIALSLYRLKCGISAIASLLRAPVGRHVRVPIGHLAVFCWCLLTSTCDDEGQTHFDPHVRTAESTAVPQIWLQACQLLSCLTLTAQELLAPHTSRLIMVISSRLENNLEPLQKLSFLRCAYHLLYFCPVVGATSAINRLLKAAISLLSPLYFRKPPTESNSGPTSQSRTSKKRRRGHETDNVLSTTNIMVCTTTDECDTLIFALDVVDQCTLNVELAPSTRSFANQVLLSLLLSLPTIPPSRLSSNSSFHGKLIRKVRDMCLGSAQESSYAMSRGTGLVLRSLFSVNLAARDELHSRIDLLLHPRRPPSVRTLPFVESLSLSLAEETAEEISTRRSLDLTFGGGDTPSVTSEPQTHIQPVVQGSLAMERLTPPVLPQELQERTLPTSIEPHPQTAGDRNSNLSMEGPTPSVAPVALPLQAVPEVRGASPLPVFQQGHAPSVSVAPMLVDELDDEELPTIDLGSDSDA